MSGASRLHLPVLLPLADEIPRSYRLRDHSLRLAGAVEAGGDLLTGAFGVNGREELKYVTARQAVGLSARALTIEFNYARRADGVVGPAERLANIEEKRRSVTALETVNIGTISRAQREEMAEILTEWFGSTAKQDPAEMLMTEPGLVNKMFEELTRVACVVYPARLAMDSSRVVWVSTIRTDPTRISGARVLHMPGATVEI